MTGGIIFLIIITITGRPQHSLSSGNNHSAYREELFQGNFFTPELMVCGDVTEKEIEVVFNKAKKCLASSCYDLIYKDESFDQTVFAPKYRQRNSDRSEL